MRKEAPKINLTSTEDLIEQNKRLNLEKQRNYGKKRSSRSTGVKIRQISSKRLKNSLWRIIVRTPAYAAKETQLEHADRRSVSAPVASTKKELRRRPRTLISKHYSERSRKKKSKAWRYRTHDHAKSITHPGREKGSSTEIPVSHTIEMEMNRIDDFNH